MRDSRPGGHPREHCRITPVGKPRRCPINKRMMDVVAGRGCANGDDSGTVGHARLSHFHSTPEMRHWVCPHGVVNDSLKAGAVLQPE